MVIFNRSNCCGARLRDITINVLDDAGATVYQSPLLNQANSLGSPAQINVPIPAGIVGRTIEVQRTPDPNLSDSAANRTVLSVRELQVLGCSVQ